MRLHVAVAGTLSVCVIVLALHVWHVEPFWTPASVTSVTCPAPYTSEWGYPAIHPRNVCSPSFTERDVRNYILASPIGPSIGRLGPPTHVTVIRVLFTTSHDASILIGEPLDLPESAVVCYVEFRGVLTGQASFIPVGVTPPPTPSNPPKSTITVVFDGRTGNVLTVTVQ